MKRPSGRSTASRRAKKNNPTHPSGLVGEKKQQIKSNQIPPERRELSAVLVVTAVLDNKSYTENNKNTHLFSKPSNSITSHNHPFLRLYRHKSTLWQPQTSRVRALNVQLFSRRGMTEESPLLFLPAISLSSCLLLPGVWRSPIISPPLKAFQNRPGAGSLFHSLLEILNERSVFVR